MPWVPRGLRDGLVTTPYPRRPDDYGPGFRAAIRVVGDDRSEGTDIAGLCPTRAIASIDGQVRVDRGRCILCGQCVERRPDRFAFDGDPEVADLTRAGLVVPPVAEDDRSLAAVRSELSRRTRALRRSVHVRHVDAGSDGAEEWEVNALLNPVYDVHRLGIFFTASPRHADLLLVTGAGTAGMVAPLRRTVEATPDPKVILAAGTDAASGGLVSPTYATRGGIGDLVDVDVWVPGSPPSPFSILHGILLGVGMLRRRRAS